MEVVAALVAVDEPDALVDEPEEAAGRSVQVLEGRLMVHQVSKCSSDVLYAPVLDDETDDNRFVRRLLRVHPDQ